MVIIQSKSKRSPTGARYRQSRGKRKFEAGSTPTHTKLEDKKTKSVRTIGGNSKTKSLSNNFVNLTDTKSKTSSKVKIKSIVENPANKNFVRRSIITKGTIIETEKGKARITSRPGQEGIINAVLI